MVSLPVLLDHPDILAINMISWFRSFIKRRRQLTKFYVWLCLD